MQTGDVRREYQNRRRRKKKKIIIFFGRRRFTTRFTIDTMRRIVWTPIILDTVYYWYNANGSRHDLLLCTMRMDLDTIYYCAQCEWIKPQCKTTNSTTKCSSLARARNNISWVDHWYNANHTCFILFHTASYRSAFKIVDSSPICRASYPTMPTVKALWGWHEQLP